MPRCRVLEWPVGGSLGQPGLRVLQSVLRERLGLQVVYPALLVCKGGRLSLSGLILTAVLGRGGSYCPYPHFTDKANKTANKTQEKNDPSKFTLLVKKQSQDSSVAFLTPSYSHVVMQVNPPPLGGRQRRKETGWAPPRGGGFEGSSERAGWAARGQGLRLLGAVLVVLNSIICDEAFSQPLVKISVITVCNDVRIPRNPRSAPPGGRRHLLEEAAHGSFTKTPPIIRSH